MRTALLFVGLALGSIVGCSDGGGTAATDPGAVTDGNAAAKIATESAKTDMKGQMATGKKAAPANSKSAHP